MPTHTWDALEQGERFNLTTTRHPEETSLEGPSKGESQVWPSHGPWALASICLNIFFPLLVLKGIYHYWNFFFPGDLGKWELLLLCHPWFQATRRSYPNPMSGRRVLQFFSLWHQLIWPMPESLADLEATSDLSPKGAFDFLEVARASPHSRKPIGTVFKERVMGQVGADARFARPHFELLHQRGQVCQGRNRTVCHPNLSPDSHCGQLPSRVRVAAISHVPCH